jgi:pimeloyl-ACP methyl ester carboxylesterase
MSALLPPLEWKPDGHTYWQWKRSGVEGGSRVHYLVSGPTDGAPIVLVHGFGASWFHFRNNVPALARTFRVYAIDLVGFGQSDKPLIAYTPEMWATQLADFVAEVVAPSAPCKVAIAGNSLGGFASLSAAVIAPELIEGVALLNAAGTFTPDPAASPQQSAADQSVLTQWTEQLGSLVRKAVLFGSFQLTKQPARIRQVLMQVYARDSTNVDDALVASIAHPASHPNAAEVFYRIVSRNAVTPSTTFDVLLGALSPATDVLLLWGEHDPWIRQTVATKIQQLRPGARRVSVDAGHCPHDEAPAAVNEALIAWASQLPRKELVLPSEPLLVAARWPRPAQ